MHSSSLVCGLHSLAILKNKAYVHKKEEKTIKTTRSEKFENTAEVPLK